jgi:hypothetical protein
MGEFQPHRRGRIITATSENSGPSSYTPDRPTPEVSQLRRLDRKFPSNINIPQSNDQAIVPIRQTWGARVSEGQRVIPIVKKPLVRAQFVDIRGGRVIGGGTSREAIRKARYKAKRNSG